MPTALRRPAAVACVLFVMILTFLAGRVHAGADPAQATAPAAERSATPAPSDSYGADPYGGFAPGGAPGGQDIDPPTTQAS